MPSQVTLKDAGQQYFETLLEAGKQERTVATYRRQFETITGFFGEDKALSAIRPADVGRFLKADALLKKPNGKDRAEPTIKQIVRVLRMMLEWAAGQGMIDSAPFPKDAMPKRKRKQQADAEAATDDAAAADAN